MIRRSGAGIAPALLLCLLAVAPGASAQDDLDEILGGFDDEDEAADAGDDELDDVLGGFEEDDGYEAGRAAEAPVERFWDLTGSTALGLSYNFRSHQSARKGTDFQHLQRMRTRLNLQLDLDLPMDWKARVAGYAFYDWAFLINGRHDYTEDHRELNEWDIDYFDTWIQGSLTESLDLKVGRQVVNWGRSDTLRILDVINPLDNREPGLVDIEDLRRSVGMARLDYYWDRFSFTFLAIPEIRFNQDPRPGSDFNPAPDLPPGIEDPNENTPGDFRNWEWGLAVTGIFEGWDVSLHFAYIYEDLGYVVSAETLPLRIQHSRLTFVGAGGNYTLGSWLFKGELAWADGYGFTDGGDRSRIDSMLGAEYYGINDTTIALEVAHRHFFDFPSQATVLTGFVVPREDAVEGALRITSTFLNDRLELTGLVVYFAGEDAHDGSVIRLQASYDLRDALVVSGGLLLFQEGDVLPQSTWGRNDRLFFEIKYSF